MSWNPVRAAQQFRNTSKKRNRYLPHEGIKHSDIMKRQGLGSTVPWNGRTITDHGFSVAIFEGDGFAVRSEVLAAGNAIGLGVNAEGDRVYHVQRGVLFVTVEAASGEKVVLQIQAGSDFRAPRGTKYGVASPGNDAVEILIVETPAYDAAWQPILESTTRALEPQTMSMSTPQDPDAPAPARRLNQDKAKQAAVAVATARGRRVPKNAAAAQRAGQTMSGEQRIGRNATTNPNSSNVNGVNPMPGGAGAFRED